VCRKHHIKRLALFGSVLRADFRPESDVDVLVEFDAGHVPGFFRLYEVQRELSAVFDGHDVDIVSFKYLNPRLRDRILDAAELQYEEG
jgi:predicted nucleotidyltransferase